MDTITIIGKGKAGTSIAEAIGRTDRYKLALFQTARTNRYPVIQSDVVIIATKDEAIAAVAKKALASALKPPGIMIHLAGSIAPTILPERHGTALMTLHPIQTFTEPDANLLNDIFWMACSDSTRAIHWARKFVRELGSKNMIELPPESLPLYHAMTVFSSNFITLLFQAIEEISDELEVNPKQMKAAVRALSERTLQNVLANPAKSVLTGPIARKDMETIEKHEKALKALDPKLKAIYDAFLSFAMPKGTTKR